MLQIKFSFGQLPSNQSWLVHDKEPVAGFPGTATHAAGPGAAVESWGVFVCENCYSTRVIAAAGWLISVEYTGIKIASHERLTGMYFRFGEFMHNINF